MKKSKSIRARGAKGDRRLDQKRVRAAVRQALHGDHSRMIRTSRWGHRPEDQVDN